MSKIVIAGVLLWILGFMAIGYSGIESFMGQGQTFETVLVIDLFGEDFIDAMDDVSWHGFQNVADYLLDAPVYAICFIAGTVLLIISSFLWRQ
jgi:membrane protein DedA with SNARE-associated domain